MISLTDKELVLLDGNVSEETQKAVDAAKLRLAAASEHSHLSAKHATFIADVLAHGKESGVLIYRHKNISSCKLCGKRAGYLKYKSGPRKGQDNYSKPLYFSGYELKDAFVSFQGSVFLGGCADCMKLVKPTLIPLLSDLECEVSKHLTGKEPKFKRFKLMECQECGWSGSEHLMGRLPAVMGGYYYGKCPKCAAENRLFSTAIKSKEGFHLEPQSEAP